MRYVIAPVALALGFLPAAGRQPPPEAAHRGDDPLRLLLAKSDAVVTGEFVSVGAVSREFGFNHYRVELKVDGVIKGDVTPGTTARLAFLRIEPTAEDALPILKEKTRVLAFLRRPPNEKVFEPVDPWLAFQHPHPELIRSLKGLIK